jgi:hypothetical protein
MVLILRCHVLEKKSLMSQKINRENPVVYEYTKYSNNVLSNIFLAHHISIFCSFYVYNKFLSKIVRFSQNVQTPKSIAKKKRKELTQILTAT